MTADIPIVRMADLVGRLKTAMRTGNEGAGVVIGAGAGALNLRGRAVALCDGMYAQYRVAKAADCLELPYATTARQGASASINPLTSLGMVETMRREGHTALAQTAAASNVGQMLNPVCLAGGIPLVNIARSGNRSRCSGILGHDTSWTVLPPISNVT
jgi:NADPH:quinone reductase-like Zn-dependent oxidoreductase